MSFEEGPALLLRYTAQLSLGGRQAALAFRDALSPQQQLAFNHTLALPWIPATRQSPIASSWSISFFCANQEGLASMLTDLQLIATAHGASCHAIYDSHSHTGRLTFGNTSASLRAVLLAWVRACVHTVYDETVTHSPALSKN